VLQIDPENARAHYNLALAYQELGDADRAKRHRELHLRYKPDDQAVERAVTLHRRRHPAADHAAAAIVVYDLKPAPADASRQIAGSPGARSAGGDTL
jgi:hypothetical protein